MTYLQKSNRPRSSSYARVLIFVVLFFIVVGGFRMVFPSFFSTIFQYIGRPLWVTRDYFGSDIERISGFITSRTAIVTENKQLKAAAENDRLKLLTLNTLKDENVFLKQQLGREDALKNKVALGAVLTKTPQTFYDTLIVDVGSDVNIHVDDLVLAGENAVIGKISVVYPHTVQVKLFSTGGEETQAFLEHDNVSVTVVGKGGGNFEIHVPQGVSVNKGDTVLLPGVLSQILGTVMDIETDPINSFQNVLVKSPVNTNQIRFVTIEKTGL